MRVYIVWVKGNKVTLKIFQVECFTSTSQEGLTREALMKLTAWHDPSASSHVLLTWLFRGQASSETLAKSTCSIFDQLNTKPTTIESHKIQGTKLKQLQHFLSWNKTNIKYSCKSQLYNYILLEDYRLHDELGIYIQMNSIEIFNIQDPSTTSRLSAKKTMY